jgi:hypothetical protein
MNASKWTALFGLLLACVLAPARARADGPPGNPSSARPKPTPLAPAPRPLPATSGVELRWLDAGAKMNDICKRISKPADQGALGCSYWASDEAMRRARRGEPLRSHKLPSGKTLCEEVWRLNVGADAPREAESQILRACGVSVDNPARRAAAVCSGLEKTYVAARQPLVAAQDAAKPAERANLEKQVKALDDSPAGRVHHDLCKKDWSAEANKPLVASWPRTKDPEIVSLCTRVRDTTQALKGKAEEVEDYRDLAQACSDELRSGGGEVASFFVPIVQGLGDFLQARAKDELVEFAVERIGKQFCAQSPGAPVNKPAGRATPAPSSPDPEKEQKLTGRNLFPKTCNLIFPKAGDADLQAITDGRFQRVISAELLELPGNLVANLPFRFSNDATENRQLQVMIKAVVDSLMEFVKDRPNNPLDFMVTLEQHVRDALASEKQALACAAGMRASGAELSGPCGLALFLTMGATAKEALGNDQGATGVNAVVVGEAWAERGVIQFCQRYGDRAGSDTQGECLLKKNVGDDFWSAMKRMAQSVVDFYNQIDAIQRQLKPGASSLPPMEAALTAAINVSGALESLMGAMSDLVSQVAVLAPAEGEIEDIKQAMTIAKDLFSAAATIVKKDFRATAASLRGVLMVSVVSKHLSDGTKRSLVFILDLAEAKDRDEVRKVFETYAAPAGTYRAKFDHDNTWMLNGFVGAFARYQVRVVDREAKSTLQQDYFQPVAALVGVDWSIVNFAEHQMHFGIMVPLVDPLELRVTDKKGTSSADFSGIFTPGLLLRLGLGRSPIALIAGARIQPLLRAPESTCGAMGASKVCWQAPVTIMAGFGVDVPMLQLH